ncbi:MAG: hypothetical protein IJ465_01145 [Clostridia bacterium]|nr:hypothetical protein [Clostridia bacterium]
MSNKAIIFGDSYSTFKGYVPDGYSVYYSENKRPETDVTDVTETWWYQVITEAQFELVLNDSWSGSTIGYTGYNGTDCSQSSSFIYRLRQLIAQDFFKQQEISTVFVFGGTNDSWSNAPLGNAHGNDFEENNLYGVLPAIAFFFQLLKKTLPHADVYCLINDELKPEISNALLAGCEKHGFTAVTPEHIDKRHGHPTVQGMKDIAAAVLAAIKQA